MRRLALLALGLSTVTAACTSLLGDFGVTVAESEGGAPNLTTEGGAGDGAGRGTPAAIDLVLPSDSAVYLGQMAMVDASRSTISSGALVFAWSFVSVPRGSRLTSGDLGGAASPTPSFVPDLAGQYVLRVQAGATGSQATGQVTIHAVLPQVFFARGDVADASSDAPVSAVYMVSDALGAGSHPVLCPDTLATTSSSGIAADALLAGRLLDFWEGPPGQPYSYAAFSLDYTVGSGYSTHLWVGTSESTCSSPPVNMGPTGFSPTPYGTEPHFSPDGSRFVVYDASSNVVTYASDGTHKHVVAPYMQGLEGLHPVYDPAPTAIAEPPRVAWTARGLAWARTTTSGWQIVTAPDSPGAATSVFMNCSGVTPREIAMLPGGAVLASYRQTRQAAEHIRLLKPDVAQNCQTERTYTETMSDAGAPIATDFDVSPDGKWLAFLWLDPTAQGSWLWRQGPTGQLPGGHVYIVPVDNSAPPRLASEEAAYYGPRWIGGGTSLAFTRLDGVTAHGAGYPATSVVVIAPDGGRKQIIAQGDGVASFVSTSGNAACNVGSRRTPATSATFVLLAQLVAIARRRRRVSS